MRVVFRLLPLAILAGCATSSGSNTYQTDIAALQAALPVVEAALATYPGTSTPAITKAETDLNAALAALAASPAPSSAATVLTDLQAIASALPPNVISPAHQAELSSAIALARLIVSALPAS